MQPDRQVVKLTTHKQAKYKLGSPFLDGVGVKSHKVMMLKHIYLTVSLK